MTKNTAGANQVNERQEKIKDRRNSRIRQKFPFWDRDNNLVTEDRRRVPDRRLDNIEVEWVDEDLNLT